jgi:hypothetical protein
MPFKPSFAGGEAPFLDEMTEIETRKRFAEAEPTNFEKHRLDGGAT